MSDQIQRYTLYGWDTRRNKLRAGFVDWKHDDDGGWVGWVKWKDVEDLLQENSDRMKYELEIINDPTLRIEDLKIGEIFQFTELSNDRVYLMIDQESACIDNTYVDDEDSVVLDLQANELDYFNSREKVRRVEVLSPLKLQITR